MTAPPSETRPPVELVTVVCWVLPRHSLLSSAETSLTQVIFDHVSVSIDLIIRMEEDNIDQITPKDLMKFPAINGDKNGR